MRRWRIFIPLAAAVAAAALVQAGALRAPFFADDWLFLDQVRAHGPVEAVMSPDPIGNFVRPLGRAAWFWLVGRASGESAFAFHAANLALWALSVGLLWAIARRLAGDRVAAVSAALFALTQAADVPVWWACGAQDLLALSLALGAILAFLSGRRWAATALLFLAPFAKETIAVAIVPAALLARESGEPWRRTLSRAAPLAVALGAWAIVSALVFGRHHGLPALLSLSPWGLPAAVYNAARTALGLEWRTGLPPWVPFQFPGALEGTAILLAVLGAGWIAAPKAAHAEHRPARQDRAGSRRGGARPMPRRVEAPALPAPAAPAGAPRPVFVALAWAVPALLPVALVGPTWSSYYFLFACAGMALALGSWLSRAPRETVVMVVLVIGLGTQQARALDEFATAPSPWSSQSHVNRFYLRRGMSVVSDMIADLRRKHPTLPPRSTFFFSGLSAFASFQVADGPLVRAVYRDTSARSWYVNAIEPAALERGPYFLLQWDGMKREFTDRTLDPNVWMNLGLGYLLDDKASLAAMAFQKDLDRKPGYGFDAYALALVHAAMGDSIEARRRFLALGLSTGRSAGPLMDTALAALARGDTAAAIAAALDARTKATYDPAPHRFLGMLLATRTDRPSPEGVLEAYAAIAMAPGDAPGWRLWGGVQAVCSHESAALRSLERYFALDPGALTRDSQARAWRDRLRDRLPGGQEAQASLKRDLR